MRFWIAFALLAPVMLLQALWTTRAARRLPAGAGEIEGIVGAGDDEPLSLLFVGESPVAGVGCPRMDQSVAAQTAAELARLTGRRVRWHAAGVNGIRIAPTISWLVPRLPDERFDVIVAVHGVNDTTGLTSVPEWRAQLARLAEALTAQHGGRVYFTQVAPMHLFSAMPQPLRAVIGMRARTLDAALHAHPARGRLFEVVDADVPVEPGFLAEDGYHPSPAGCAVWGQAIARALAQAALS